MPKLKSSPSKFFPRKFIYFMINKYKYSATVRSY